MCRYNTPLWFDYVIGSEATPVLPMNLDCEPLVAPKRDALLET